MIRSIASFCSSGFQSLIPEKSIFLINRSTSSEVNLCFSGEMVVGFESGTVVGLSL